MSVTITVRTETAAAFVRVSQGEYLLYKITSLGPKPLFTLVDARADKLLLSQDDEPASNIPLVHQRKWPLPADQPIKTATNHTLGVHFLGAVQDKVKYTYVVELRKSDNTLKRTLIDKDYESTTPADWFFQAMGVNSV